MVLITLRALALVSSFIFGSQILKLKSSSHLVPLTLSNFQLSVCDWNVLGDRDCLHALSTRLRPNSN